MKLLGLCYISQLADNHWWVIFSPVCMCSLIEILSEHYKQYNISRDLTDTIYSSWMVFERLGVYHHYLRSIIWRQ